MGEWIEASKVTSVLGFARGMLICEICLQQALEVFGNLGDRLIVGIASAVVFG